jgi:quinol monooxygenase YgiN
MNIMAGHGVYMRVRVKPEKRAEFIGIITGLVRNIKANEPDTLVYEFLEAADPNEFVFFERFTNQAAYDKHQQMPYHVAISAAGWACLAGDPIIEPLTPLAP